MDVTSPASVAGIVMLSRLAKNFSVAPNEKLSKTTENTRSTRPTGPEKST